MALRFAELLFTRAVRAAQARYGGRADRLLTAADPRDRLGPDEVEFLQTRDGFHLATVGETGWPYVQFRGGPPGFLQVLDERTIAWADFRGNRQYVSTGNLDPAGEARVAIIAMDHARQLRIKLLGTAQIIDADADPELAARVTVPGYRAVVERIVVVTLAAFDWNCPQHITPRYTAEELQDVMAPLVAELEQLRAENARLRSADPRVRAG
ncbi:pyridoxamine 5'-phosphate oxidase family protein [Pseudonocardia alaniniphila]|uniref:Pyridoxamine 5'-phosphate oxidase family protein n=1 Tax=Pseudonocardia alaniniphila TaxID=75291 RepID=A0ABS9TTV9_9PSEU|nr:pyridoxamine 5'-phosphate oxidase family protein [Pseudonocardia alaniniphila]MCH6171937.1 pyridoxamine 5'-phosphate oxidase family protein [Pseudonocardia alaniniphila]